MNTSIFDETLYIEEATGDKTKVKNFSDTYLYHKGSYEKNLVNFLLTAHRVNKDSDSFKDLAEDIKKNRVANYFNKVVSSPKTIFCIGETSLPRAFKVFVGKDVKSGSNDLCLFIDVTGIIKENNNTYSYNRQDLGILVSYILAGAHAMMYYANPAKLTNNVSLVENASMCFAKMTYYIIDYLRLSADPSIRGKVMYYASKYFQLCVMNREMTNAVETRALKNANISEREAELINDLTLDGIKEPYKDYPAFIKSLAAITKSTLSEDVFLEKWMYSFGAGTHFGLEHYPSYANILIYAYVGAYLNNQKTIEKIVGQDMVEFVNDVNRIGGEMING